MKQLLLLLLIVGCYALVNAGKCTRPNLSRQKVYIYSTVGKVPVKISRCLFSGTKDAYSDISDNCVKAFQSGVFIDKWDEKNILEDKGSPIVLEEYVSKADLVKNEVLLRSGRTCRYDRGFCYDPTETNTYAIVWEILEKSNLECPSLLYKVFEGDVDIWEFKQQGLSYLFYYDSLDDEAFYLSLQEKGKCQENDVWNTEEGYVISMKPLAAKDIERKAAFRLPTKGVKGGVKGGSKGAKLVARNDEYFSLRTKKVVSELILKNCDIRSLTMQQIIKEVDSDYLENPHNLQLILERYYNLIMATKEDLLEIIKKQNTLEITNELREKLIILTERFEKTVLHVKEIQDILASAGNLEGIRVDVDELAAKLVALLKKHEEYYDVVIKEIQVSIQSNTENINSESSEIKALTEKLQQIQNVINKQIPEFITKSEVYDKINKVEQEFHQKLKDLALNVTLLLLNFEENGKGEGIQGKNTERLQIETLIIDKLKSYNVDQFQSALDGLKDKIELLLDELSYETYQNITTVEEKLLLKLTDLAAKNEPILERLNEYEEKINKLFSDVKDLRADFEQHNIATELTLKEIDLQFKKIFDTFGGYDKLIIELKQEVNALSLAEVDFNPVYENVKTMIDNSLEPRDDRLQSLEVISVKVGESVDANTENIVNLNKEISDIAEQLKKFDSLKDGIKEECQKEILHIQEKIETVVKLIDELSEKVDGIDKDLQDSKKMFIIELEKLANIIKEGITNVNITTIENRDLILKIQNQDTEILNYIDELKKDFIGQGQSIKDIEILIKEETTKTEAEHEKINELINNLNENITDIYDILKNQEDSILVLKKNSEKSTSKGYTKGGVKTSNIKTGGRYNQQQVQEQDLDYGLDYEWGNANSKYSGSGSSKGGSYRTKRAITTVRDDYGHYQTVHDDHDPYQTIQDEHDHHHGQTKTYHEHSSSLTENDIYLIVKEQKTEIILLKEQLREAHNTLDEQGHRIEHLETKIDELVNRLLNHENRFEREIKAFNTKLTETHNEAVKVEEELKQSFSRCCSSRRSKSSYGNRRFY